MKQFVDKTKLINIFKISLAAIVAIVVANWLQLEFAVSAGIVAILSVQPTKKETFRTAISRLIAFIVAMLIAYGSFTLSGCNVRAFFMYLVIFIGVCQAFSWNSAMAMNSVLISHFITLGDMKVDTIINESLIFIIGVGFGILVNLHLHKNSEYVEKMKEETDALIKQALHRMSLRIVDHKLPDYDGTCFEKINKSIREAKNIAEENYMNQFGKKDTVDLEYISMRERQVHVLYEMYKSVSGLQTTPITAKTISEFLDKMSKEYHEDNSVEDLLKEFYIIDNNMKSTHLPTERKEFEDRAELYILLRYIEEFLNIKREYVLLHNVK